MWSGTAGSRNSCGGAAAPTTSFNTAHTTTSSSLSNFNPSITASLQAVVSQPLLRDFKIDPARAQLDIAERNQHIADIGLQERIARTSADAESAYWNLVLARAAVAVQQQSLDLSLELERNNRARVDVGQSPPLDLVSARAEVAQRRENLIVAQTLVRQAEDVLRTLVFDPKRTDFWFVRLEPADVVPPIGPPPDVDAAVRNALSERPDLAEARSRSRTTRRTSCSRRTRRFPICGCRRPI